MKTKNIVLVGIAVCAISLLLISPVLANEDDYVLDIYGNANEDDTIDMRDFTFTARIILWLEDETDLADANFDGDVNVLDMTQIGLIILGRESELTVIDTKDRIVTVKKPVTGIVIPHIHPVEMLRALKVEKDKIVGVGYLVVADNVFFPEFSEVSNVGSPWNPDVEAILNLHPDVVILHPWPGWPGGALDKAQEVLESADVTVLRFKCNDVEIQPEEARKLGYIFDKQDEAEQFIDWRENFLNLIEERVEEIPEEDKPTVYYEHGSYGLQEWAYGHVEMAGGKDIFADLNYWDADVKVDPEDVVDQNPAIIVHSEWSGTGVGYGVDADDAATLEEAREEVMSRLAGVTAVEKDRVYIITPMVSGGGGGSGARGFLEFPYLAKWFHPKLFTELDPKAIHQEYLTRFQGLDIDLDEKGVFVYPEPS